MRRLVAIIGFVLLVTPAMAQTKALSAQNAVQLGAFDTAIETIGEPGLPEEFYWLGRAQLGLQRYDEAEATFQSMLDADERSSMAYDGLAHVANARKDYAGGLEKATKAIELNEGNAEAYHAQGVAYAYMQNLPKAQESLAKAVQMNPSNPYAHYQLGLIYNRLNKFDQTVIHFTRFLQLLPNAPEAPQVKSILRTSNRR
jgi:tetratricopeptide (TPR) repeat protein